MENQCLVIIDIQNDYFEGGSNPLKNSDSAVVKAKKILEKFREKNLPVVFVQHISVRAGSTFFLPGTFGADFHPLMDPGKTDKVIVKNFPNSFRNTDLLKYLQSIDAKKLVICGMMTHMCVNATTRAAKDLGFECVVIGDACATKNLEYKGEIIESEKVHQSFLAAMGYFDAHVVNAEEFLI